MATQRLRVPNCWLSFPASKTAVGQTHTAALGSRLYFAFDDVNELK